MESNLFKKYMQNIEDFVFIEEKIVTYLWLCQILKIHVNTAKQLLHAFATKDDVKNRLLITYVLGGELKNGKGRLLKLVIEDSKQAVEQLFLKKTTDHIFSIQRSGGSFSSTDIFNSFPHFSVLPETRRFCPIRPIKEIEKRDINHITEAKNFLNPSLPVKKNITPKETESSKKDDKNAEGSRPSISDTPEVSNEPPSKQKKTSGNGKDLKNKSGSIGCFFNRQADKKSLEQPAGDKVKTEKKEEKAKTGIDAFFKPGNKSDISTKEVKERKEKETTANSETMENEKEKKDVPEAKKQNVKESTCAPAKDKKQKSKESKRKRKKKDDDGMEKKRRKRIVSALSSDSESSGNESSDHEMEVEPEPPAPPPVEEDEEDMIPPTPGRKRVRKQIDNVSIIEDGFIITKKEFVYESCSDDEAKEDKKENIENNVKEDKKVKTSPLNKDEPSAKNGKQNKSSDNDKSNKQSSIMTFFKRKAVT